MVFTADQPERLDRFLARLLPDHSRTKLARLIDAGEVKVDGHSTKPSATLAPGMVVDIASMPQSELHDLTPADIPLEVIFEDQHLLVVNKPRGLAAHPAASLKEPSLVNALLSRSHTLSQSAGAFRPGIVHRLDKDTTGLMVVAKTDAAHVILAKQMESKSAERRYAAVVAGNVAQERFKIDAPVARDKRNRIKMAVDPDGKTAVSHVHKIATLPQGTLVVVRLETGRTHQIRVHLRAVGLPVLGDKIYAPKEFASGLLQLHAAHLAFTHPITKKRLAFYAEPDDGFLGKGILLRSHLEDFPQESAR